MDLCIGLTMVALGSLLAFGLGGISFGAGYDRIGPRFFPFVVAIGLVLLGAWFLAASVISRPRPQSQQEAAPVNWFAVWHLALALALTLLLLEPAGFVIACALQFWLVARAFGSSRPVRDAIVAASLSVVCFVAFASGLGLTLPSGVLEGIL